LNNTDVHPFLQVLLRYGADMDARNGRGETPMHLAARNEFHQILDLLVGQAADPLIEDNDGHKPIDLVPDDEIVIRQTLKSAMQVGHLVSLLATAVCCVFWRS